MWSSDLTPDLDVFIDEKFTDESRLNRTSENRLVSDMPVVVCASQKGGSGKTTLASHIAVQAERSGAGPVALIDTDPQGSLADWWNTREADAPVFVKTHIGQIGHDLADLRDQGISLVVIDTPPAVTSMIQGIIRFADLVVIPTRPSPLDLRAVGPTVDMVEHESKALVFVVNAATPRARITTDAAIALSQHGAVAPQVVHHRNDFAQSMIDGRTVMELRENSKSSSEISELWAYIDERLEQTVRHPHQEGEVMAEVPAGISGESAFGPDHRSEKSYVLTAQPETGVQHGAGAPNRWFGRRQTG
jgi:chromosome partitioning protein